MKNKNFNNWNYTPDIESLAFFSNLVDEMTFNYTTDSFKAPALNVISLMQETLSTIIDVDSGNIANAALVSIFEELTDAMKNDQAFIETLKNKKLDYLVSNTNFKETPIKVTANILTILLEKNNIAKEYSDYLKRELIRLIKETNHKKDIEQYTRSLITQLRNDGYSDDYLYFSNYDFFFGKERIIESKDIIDDYFQMFDSREYEYEVYFIGHKLVGDIETNDEYDVVDGINNENANQIINRYIRRKSGTSKFLKFALQSKDPYSARLEALRRLRKHFSLLNLYHHKYMLDINPNCLVYDRINDKAIVIKDTTRAILKCKDQRIRKAIENHRETISKMHFDETSTLRVFNALKLHDEAIADMNLENQYINLFTAIEVLIPKDIKSNKDRILQIYDTLVPYLCVNYYQKLLDSLLQSLLLWNRTETLNRLGEVEEGNNNIEKLAVLMVLSKYDSNGANNLPLDKLYAKLKEDKYTLMLNRMNKFHKILNNKRELLNFLQRHEKRLKWHIDRIYRVRNNIVHAGKSPKYLGTLVENLHSYLDILLNQLIYDNIENGYEDIEHSFTSCFLKYRNYLSEISEDLQKRNNTSDLTNVDGNVLYKAIFI